MHTRQIKSKLDTHTCIGIWSWLCCYCWLLRPVVGPDGKDIHWLPDWTLDHILCNDIALFPMLEGEVCVWPLAASWWQLMRHVSVCLVAGPSVPLGPSAWLLCVSLSPFSPMCIPLTQTHGLHFPIWYEECCVLMCRYDLRARLVLLENPQACVLTWSGDKALPEWTIHRRTEGTIVIM